MTWLSDLGMIVMQSDQLTAAAQKAAAMEGATIAEVSNLRLELQECEVTLQNTVADRDNRNRQLEVLLNSTIEWERRVESSDMEYQAMSAALGDEKRKNSHLRQELIGIRSPQMNYARKQTRHKQAPLSGVGVTFSAFDDEYAYDRY